MRHKFSAIPSVQVPRSVFDRRHQYKTTLDSGYLVPFYVDEVLPGDTFTCDSTLFARMTTPIAPIMDNVYMETFYFSVPLRLVWENFQRFMGERIDPNDPNETTEFLIPQISSGENGFELGTLSDYFGLPVNVPNLSVSSLWHRAYNLIYNEWFRDENLQSPVPVPKDDGPDTLEDYKLLRRGKRHDYFTSALPWPQKGDPVGIGLTGAAPVFGIDNEPMLLSGDYPIGSSVPALTGYLSAAGSDSNRLTSLGVYTRDVSDPPASYALNVIPKGDKSSGLYADLSEVTSVTVNSLRLAFQLQRLLEKDARGGTRYTEILRSQFGVISPDARLQRPEYLGGNHSRIHFNPVQQTSSTDSTSPQGNLTAFALGSSSGRGFSKSFVEHSLIIGLVSIRADLTYQRGINRMFSRRTRMDFYWPTLAHLGEQAILNKEIYAQGNSIDDDVFGYQERWAEYRYKPSLITGKMRSGIPGSLDIWHLSQDFGSLPVLNSDFIEEKPPIERILAIQDEPQFLLDVDINLRCARPMPVYSVPGLIDHF